MSERSHVAGGARAVALAVSSRRRLLEVLRSALHPLDAEQLAAAVGVHVTTARHHLGLLERAGLVQRAVERAGRRGRPRILYTAAPESVAGDGYRILAQVLAAELGSDPDAGRRRAERAGRRWVRQQFRPGGAGSAEETLGAVTRLFDALGFAPRRDDDGPRHRLLLEACPLREIARAHAPVVCTVHLGLLRGALDQLGAAGAAGELQPFVELELCVAEIRFPATGM